jgi:predicted transcriptional regulator
MRKPLTLPAQGELLDRRADTTFTHLFNAIFSTGDAREMGETSFMVLCCIKSYASLNTGQSFPSMDTIAEKIGKSRDTVERSIKRLVEMGYVEVCGKRGRNNVYRIKERFPITNGEGKMVEAAWWDYVPTAVAEVQRQVKQYAEKGRVEGQQVIHIEKIEVNINYGTQIGTQVISAENVQMNDAYDVDALKSRMINARDAEFDKIQKLIPGLNLKSKQEKK